MHHLSGFDYDIDEYDRVVRRFTSKTMYYNSVLASVKDRSMMQELFDELLADREQLLFMYQKLRTRMEQSENDHYKMEMILRQVAQQRPERDLKEELKQRVEEQMSVLSSAQAEWGSI